MYYHYLQDCKGLKPKKSPVLPQNLFQWQIPPWQLIRLDVRDGQRDTVYEFPHQSGARPILTVDRDGAVIVSMARLGETRQARFWEEAGEYRAQRLAPLGATLHRPMVVDEIDYASITEVPHGLLVTRQAQLSSLGDVATCPCVGTFGELL